jgi:hypothetical protein
VASYLVFDVNDVHSRVSPWRMRIDDQVVDPDTVTFANAIATAAFGNLKPSQGGLKRAYIEVDAGVDPIAPAADSDTRQNWQAILSGVGVIGSRMSIPGRNDAVALYNGPNTDLALLTESHWAALIAAMFGSSPAVLNTKDGDAVTGFSQALATVRARKRRREGGSR